MRFTSEPLTRSRWSDVYIASTAQLFGALCTFLVMFTLVLSLQQRGGQGWQVSALIIAESLPMVVLGKLAGKLIDRVDSRVLLIVAGTGQGLAVLALSYVESFGYLVAGALALAVATSLAQPTRAALLPAMVTRDDLPRASAIGQTAGSIGMMVGPALAGVLLGTLHSGLTLRIASLGFASTVLAGLLLRTRRGGIAPAPSASDEAVPTSSWKLSSDKMLWTAAWGITVVIAAISATNVVEVFFVQGTLKSTPTVYGVITSMWTVGILVGAWVYARRMKPATSDGAAVRLLFLGLGGLSAAILVTGTVSAAAWIIPCYLAGGLINGGQNVIMGTLMGRRVPAEARGRAQAALQSRVQGGALVGYILGGLLLELSEPRWLLLGSGALGVVVAAAVTVDYSRRSAVAQAG